MSTEVEAPPAEQPEVVKSEEEEKVEENHVEEKKTEGEEEASDKPKDGEVIEEAKKEENGMAPSKLKLHQPAPAPNVPCSLPTCLSLETYLRMNKIPYENAYASTLTANKVKMPCIEYQGDKVQDVRFCIQYINKKFNVDPDASLTAEQKAICHAFQAMVEENTYWSLVYYRWVDNYQETKKYYENMAPLVSSFRSKMDKNKCIKCMEAHGIGKHTKEEVYSIAESDLESISALLGDKEFFMGSDPTTIDCTMFGLLANLIYGAPGSPQEKLIQEKLKNLVDFCDRMKLNFWLDYGEICSADNVEEFKPRSILRKSQRKESKKEGKKEKKEGEATAEQKEEEKADEEPDKKEEAETKPDESAEGEAAEEKDEEKKEEKPSEEAVEKEPQATSSDEQTDQKPAEE